MIAGPIPKLLKKEKNTIKTVEIAMTPKSTGKSKRARILVTNKLTKIPEYLAAAIKATPLRKNIFVPILYRVSI